MVACAHVTVTVTEAVGGFGPDFQQKSRADKVSMNFIASIYSVDVYFSSDARGFIDALSAQMGYEIRWCWLCGKQTSSTQWRHCPPVLQLKPPQKKDNVTLESSQASQCLLGQRRKRKEGRGGSRSFAGFVCWLWLPF